MNEEEKLTILIRGYGYSEEEIRRKVKGLLNAKKQVQYLANNLIIIVLVLLWVLVSYLLIKLRLVE